MSCFVEFSSPRILTSKEHLGHFPCPRSWTTSSPSSVVVVVAGNMETPSTISVKLVRADSGLAYGVLVPTMITTLTPPLYGTFSYPRHMVKGLKMSSEMHSCMSALLINLSTTKPFASPSAVGQHAQYETLLVCSSSLQRAEFTLPQTYMQSLDILLGDHDHHRDHGVSDSMPPPHCAPLPTSFSIRGSLQVASKPEPSPPPRDGTCSAVPFSIDPRRLDMKYKVCTPYGPGRCSTPVTVFGISHALQKGREEDLSFPLSPLSVLFNSPP